MNDELVAVEGEVVGQEGVELVPAPITGSTLFHTDDPVEVLKRAQETAQALMPVVREKGLTAKIGDKEYLLVEAWQTLGAMLGVTPVCTSTAKLEDGWEARVEARTLDGRVIGAAEAECLRAETRWAKADDFAIRSMAQTRATSKALASVLRFVATLAGFAGTPYEEATEDMKREGGPPKISPKQLDFIATLLKKAGVTGEDMTTIHSWALDNLTGGKTGSASKAIDALMKDADAGAERLLKAALTWQGQQTDLPVDDSDLPVFPDQEDVKG